MFNKALENTDKVVHLVIPAKPADLSDADLEKVAGGAGGLMQLVAYGAEDVE
jgi:hypothetical protein